MTTRISAAAGVRQLEISPVLSRVKQAGSLMDGLHLATPGLPPGMPAPSHDHAASPARVTVSRGR